MDGNRRWARKVGLASPSLGHKAGAEHVDDVLGWCEALDIRHVTVFVCSTENLERRGEAEVAFLMGLITQTSSPTGWPAPAPAGNSTSPATLSVLPDHHRARPQGGRGRQPGLRHRRSTSPSPSATAGGRRSSTRCANC